MLWENKKIPKLVLKTNTAKKMPILFDGYLTFCSF